MRPFRCGISKAVYCTIASLLIGQLASAQPAMADKRVALVIGNGAYIKAPRLSSPPGDAAAMAKMLGDAGFDVITGIDLTQADMQEKEIEFERQLACADLAVLYFAGHGLTLNRTNYLLPVDANFKSDWDILRAAINLDRLLSNPAKVKLAFIDAGRDDRFDSALRSISLHDGYVVQSGLNAWAPDLDSLLVLSTPPGQPGPDHAASTISPFAQALIDQIPRPGVDIGQAIAAVRTQLAKEMLGIKTFSQWDAVPKISLNPVRERDVVMTDLEERLYKWIGDMRLRDVEKLAAYLKLFPRGKFSGLVMLRIVELGSPRPIPLYRPSSRDIPADAPGLNACAVQRQLRALGYQTGKPGRLDGQTRLAIRDWQTARGYLDNGYIDDLQSMALAAEGAAAEAGIFNETLFRAPIKD